VQDSVWAGQQEQVAVARLFGALIHIFQEGQPLWTIRPDFPDFPQVPDCVAAPAHPSTSLS
jgi:hypothetical protein